MERYPAWTSYDAEGLMSQYWNKGKVPDWAVYVARWTALAEPLRVPAAATALDIPYGSGPSRQIDLFLPQDSKDPPLHIFIHGGYWQYNTRHPYAFLAPPFNAAGAALATVGYPLTPEVTMTELVGCVRIAIAHLWRNAAALGFDRDRMHVSGNSAGGHLTASMVLTDWPSIADDLPRDLLKSGIAISGIITGLLYQCH